MHFAEVMDMVSKFDNGIVSWIQDVVYLKIQMFPDEVLISSHNN